MIVRTLRGGHGIALIHKHGVYDLPVRVDNVVVARSGCHFTGIQSHKPSKPPNFATFFAADDIVFIRRFFIPLLLDFVRGLVEPDGIFNVVFRSRLAVIIHIEHVFGSVGQAGRAVETAAFAGHALDEVFGEPARLELEERNADLLESVAVERADGDAVFGGELGHALPHAAGLGKDTSVEGGVFEPGLGQILDLDLPCVQKGL